MSLQEKLIESNYISKESYITLAKIKEILIARFIEIDFNEAKNDVMPFIKDTSKLDIWSKVFL